MNRKSVYDPVLLSLLEGVSQPQTKRELGRALDTYLKATSAETWEPWSHTKYITVTEPISMLTGLEIGTRYAFFEDGITTHPWWDFVTLVHRRWWRGWAPPLK